MKWKGWCVNMIASGVRLKELLPHHFIIEHNLGVEGEVSVVTNVYGSLAGKTILTEENKSWQINITYEDILDDDLIYEINFPMYLHLTTMKNEELIEFLKAVSIT